MPMKRVLSLIWKAYDYKNQMAKLETLIQTPDFLQTKMK